MNETKNKNGNGHSIKITGKAGPSPVGGELVFFVQGLVYVEMQHRELRHALAELSDLWRERLEASRGAGLLFDLGRERGRRHAPPDEHRRDDRVEHGVTEAVAHERGQGRIRLQMAVHPAFGGLEQMLIWRADRERRRGGRFRWRRAGLGRAGGELQRDRLEGVVPSLRLLLFLSSPSLPPSALVVISLPPFLAVNVTGSEDK